MRTPRHPKIYHIVHVDRLPSIIEDGYLWCDAKISRSKRPGTRIGTKGIKKRRLNLPLSSYPDLHVGDCVPFYFCKRPVMLCAIYYASRRKWNYTDVQNSIVHLEADLWQTVAWAEENEQRWVFTLSNAGSFDFQDRCDLAQLGEIDWKAVRTRYWLEHKEGKQAEFLIERQFPWELVSRIAVRSREICRQAMTAREAAAHKPDIQIRRKWYY